MIVRMFGRYTLSVSCDGSSAKACSRHIRKSLGIESSSLTHCQFDQDLDLGIVGIV